MTKNHFRLATHKDIRYMTAAINNLTHFEQRLSPDVALTLKQSINNQVEDWLATLMDATNYTVIMVETDEQASGFIIGCLESPANSLTTHVLLGKILLLWVDEPHRRQHLGSSLLAAMEAHFLEKNAEYIEMEHVYTNILAKSFWHNKGYKPASLIRRKMFKEHS